MKINFLHILLILCFAVAPMAHAEFESLEASPWTQVEGSYMEKSMNKLGFGLLNFLTGWTALLYEPYRYDNKFTGLVKGAWRTITNTAGGAVHAVTFPVPVDVPLPDGGVSFDH